MAIIVLTYADAIFFKSQRIAKKAALAHGADRVIMRDDVWLRGQKDFYDKNKELLARPRGAGYWVWKPYIILEALKNLADDDILFYHDSGAELIADIKPLADIVNQKKIMLFRSHGFTNSGWTKRDCFYFMDCDNSRYYDGPQVLSGFLMLKKTPENISLITEWLNFASNKHIITDDENICGLDNLAGFHENRHDQAILSLLAIKHNIQAFRDPSQCGELSQEILLREKDEPYHHNSPYPTLFNLHRGGYRMQFWDYAQYYYQHKQYRILARHIAAHIYRSIKPRKR